MLTNCFSKQFKAVYVFANVAILGSLNPKEFGKLSAIAGLYEDWFQEPVSIYTCYLAKEIFQKHEKKIRRFTAYFLATGATLDQAQKHYKKFEQNYWFGQRSELVGLLNVAQTLAECALGCSSNEFATKQEVQKVRQHLRNNLTLYKTDQIDVQKSPIKLYKVAS